jgi:hypothetical protein
VARLLKIVALSIGVTALTVLSIYGVAIWVFIPLLPAGLIFVMVLYSEKQRHHGRKSAVKEEKGERRKAA